LSVTQLLDKGYNVLLFEDKKCVIKDANNIEMINVQMKGKSFALDLMNEEQQVAVHKEDDNTMIRHKRLGHFHHHALLFMKKNNMVNDLPELDNMPPQCAACQYVKHNKLPFPQNKAWRASQKLQLVHTNVGGPMKTPSLNENAGIGHQFTTPYTPQHNGVVERKNITIMEMKRCLLHDKGLPNKSWVEAVNTSVFLLNKLQTKALQKKTPFQVWHGYKPKLDMNS